MSKDEHIKEYLPHTAILRKPVLVTKLHTNSKAICSYCKKEFTVANYVTKDAEDIDTGVRKIYLTSLQSDPKDECKERTYERLPDMDGTE